MQNNHCSIAPQSGRSDLAPRHLRLVSPPHERQLIEGDAVGLSPSSNGPSSAKLNSAETSVPTASGTCFLKRPCGRPAQPGASPSTGTPLSGYIPGVSRLHSGHTSKGVRLLPAHDVEDPDVVCNQLAQLVKGSPQAQRCGERGRRANSALSVVAADHTDRPGEGLGGDVPSPEAPETEKSSQREGHSSHQLSYRRPLVELHHQFCKEGLPCPGGAEAISPPQSGQLRAGQRWSLGNPTPTALKRIVP